MRGILDPYLLEDTPPLAAVPIGVGATATFTDKLVNDSTSAAAMTFSLPSSSQTFPGAVDCTPNYTVTVKSGSTDISAPALSTGYTTAVLAPKQSISLTITIKHVGNAPCNDPLYNGGGWFATTTDPSSQHTEIVWLSLPDAVS